ELEDQGGARQGHGAGARQSDRRVHEPVGGGRDAEHGGQRRVRRGSWGDRSGRRAILDDGAAGAAASPAEAEAAALLAKKADDDQVVAQDADAALGRLTAHRKRLRRIDPFTNRGEEIEFNAGLCGGQYGGTPGKRRSPSRETAAGSDRRPSAPPCRASCRRGQPTGAGPAIPLPPSCFL